MKKISVEFVVGLFLIIGLSAATYLSVVISGVAAFDSDNYRLMAKFENSSGLKRGASIEIAGVRIGKVASIALDSETQESLVWLEIDKGVEVQDDAVASIRTAGIIGDKYIKISAGGGDILTDGDEIIETEPSISIEELVSKYIFDS
ncbi:MAG: outer membrane lipid asymmetry maintenance protein MlaD [Gammaproteobacteria bacterium]|nr:MAG: outer membrane lipid asymmetry maintenance protein MlaD [Gammaproteobacteria bacterium]